MTNNANNINKEDLSKNEFLKDKGKNNGVEQNTKKKDDNNIITIKIENNKNKQDKKKCNC